MKEDKAGWVSFFQRLKGRGLDGVKLIVGDKRMGMEGICFALVGKSSFLDDLLTRAYLVVFYISRNINKAMRFKHGILLNYIDK